PGRRGARDRVVRRSAGPSLALMTRAYVSLIASHAAPYRFMPKHHVSRGLPDWMPPRMHPPETARVAGFAGVLRNSCGFFESRVLQELCLRSQAALEMLPARTYAGAGRPMISASPHTVQAHSWQSPSGTSGQLAGSA